MAIRWIMNGETHSAETYNRPLRDFIAEGGGTYVTGNRKITVGNGLSGGGNLSGNINIDGVLATTTHVGVARYATMEEVATGEVDGLAISPLRLGGITSGIGTGGQRWRHLGPNLIRDTNGDIQVVESQRAIGVEYINDTNLPIMVNINPHASYGGNGSAGKLYVDGLLIAFSSNQRLWAETCFTAIVPVGSSYRFVSTGMINAWSELR